MFLNLTISTNRLARSPSSTPFGTHKLDDIGIVLWQPESVLGNNSIADVDYGFNSHNEIVFCSIDFFVMGQEIIFRKLREIS